LNIEALARQKRLSAADSRAQRAAAALLRINPDAYRQAVAHYREPLASPRSRTP
jgi:hypothetical protein